MAAQGTELELVSFESMLELSRSRVVSGSFPTPGKVVRIDSENSVDKSTWLGSENGSDNEEVNTEIAAVDVDLTE